MNRVMFIVWVLGLVRFSTSVVTSLSHQRPVVDASNGVIVIKKCTDKERNALLDFKSHLQDPNGTLSSWRVEEELDDCCKWSGITCDNETGHVTKLFLRGGGLEGEISPSLLNLTYLTNLDLYDNSFHGTIPTFIGSLSKLRSLNLCYNNLLNGTIPSEFGNLRNLEMLFLANLTRCSIENIDWLSRLSKLESLNMDGVSLAKANNWVNVILNLRKLSSLSLSDCDLSRVMLPYSSSSSTNFSSSSSKIVTLELRNNNLDSSLYDWLFTLTSNNSLEYLDLAFNMLDRIPKYLGNLCTLAYLDISSNSVAIRFSDFLNNLSGCTSLTLQSLDASNSQFTGSLSDEIGKFSSLTSLYLSHNLLNGTISEKVWELPKLVFLDVSNNSLKVVPSIAHMSNLSSIEDIDLSTCKLIGPHFPKWIQNLKNLSRLNIANTRISDTIPIEFWNTWPSQLTYLNLASNNITGKVPDLISNFISEYSSIDLSFNEFYGPIPNVPSSLETLDLSRNKFSGEITFLCHIVNGSLSFLDLSNNYLTGPIPDCLWHFKKLKVLNLSHNNLSGRVPNSIESLIELEVLYLYNNDFSGELPWSLRNCTKLTFLDLGTNRFSGNVPYWIGENLSRLYVIILTSNNFFGTIPLQLCQLVNLQILDLSKNNLNGNIPSCVSNLTAMVQDGFSQNQKVHRYEWRNTLTTYAYTYTLDSEYVDHAMIMWKGTVREFSNTLGLVKTIDLSNNNLTGQIPYELKNLNQLVSLNLSTNSLQGEIPREIGHMKELQILDLSRNNLSGGLPSSMSVMTSLDYLDVSNNNLSGRIPSSTQLQSFEPSRYTGNEELCGPPMTKKCLADEESRVPPPTIRESEGGGEVGDELDRWFYIGGASGFATGFCIVCSALLLNRRGRHVFFNFLDSLKSKGDGGSG